MPTSYPDYPMEDFAASVPVLSCDNDPKPGVLAFEARILQDFGGAGWGISRACDANLSSRHHEGRAWDWHPPSMKIGWAVVRCFTDPDQDGVDAGWARRAGLRVIIFDGMIWSSGRPTWRPYGKTGNATIEHRDHVHFTFSWPGALGHTSYYQMIQNDIAAEGAPVTEIETVSLWGAPGAKEHTDDAFRRKVVRIARRGNLNPSALLAVMSFETAGTFNPRITPGGKDFSDNPRAAVGLIQFTRRWAPVVVGITTAELAEMTQYQQLSYVEKWFDKTGGTVRSIADHYAAVFAPTCVGAAASRVAYVKGTPAYRDNAPMDVDGDGFITCGDITHRFMDFVYSAQRAEPIEVRLAPPDVATSERLAQSAGVALAALAAAVAIERLG